MKKRIIPVLLVAVLLVCILPGAASAAEGFTGFARVNTYQSGLYTDVATSAWYAAYAQAAYEYGLMSGTSDSTFSPDDSLTVAETVKLAASIHSTYYSGAQGIETGEPWYRPYVEYALKNNIVDGEYSEYGAPVTRSEFAQILSKALPEEALSVRNAVDDGAIPDVPSGFSYAPAVYLLYRAGVLTGDASGYFHPNNTLTRAEAAAIITRMVNADYRQSFAVSLDLTTAEIFDRCAPAVFFVEIYDINGKIIKTGSGFFIDPSGVAVTNFHVVKGGARAVAIMSDGEERDVLGLVGYSKEKDLALIRVEGSGFPYLEMSDAAVVTGSDAWALGSPLGFKNTISKGIISGASRNIDGRTYIQTTAAISPGSSGGALLNGAGRVIGVTTATAVGAQNLNLALPIDTLKEIKTAELMTLESILPGTVYYTNYYPVPDFGVYTNTPAYKSENNVFYYRVSDIPVKVESALDGYLTLLEDNNFSFYGYAIENGLITTYYLNTSYGRLMTFGYAKCDGIDCIRVLIMSV